MKMLEQKHFCMLILLVSAMVSCNKTDDPVVTRGDGTISFGSVVPQTKTLVTDESAMDDFRVYGYFTFSGNDDFAVFDENGDGVEEGVVVTKEQTSIDDIPVLVWTAPSTTTRYWVPNAKYSFAAFYPSDSDVSITDYAINQNGEFTGFGFSYNHTDPAVDFMVAEASTTTAEMEASGYPALSLEFEHLLSNISINLQAGAILDNIYINSYTLTGMYSQASYSYDEGEWTSEASDRSFSVSGTFDTPQLLDFWSPFALLGDDGINCVPSAYSYGEVVLELDCTVNGSRKSYSLKFPANTWEKGARYTYTAALKSDEDEGEPSVSIDIDLDEVCFTGDNVEVSCTGVEPDNVIVRYVVSDTEPDNSTEWDTAGYEYTEYNSTYYFTFPVPVIQGSQTKLWVRIQDGTRYSDIEFAYVYNLDSNWYSIKLYEAEKMLAYDADSGVIMADYAASYQSDNHHFQLLFFNDVENIDQDLYTECKVGKIKMNNGSYLWYNSSDNKIESAILDFVATEFYFCKREDGIYDILIKNLLDNIYLQAGSGDEVPSVGIDKLRIWQLISVEHD